MAIHFQTISAIVQDEQLYDHSVSLNTDLFQTYFNMSITIATEMNYLETQDDKLDKILAQQIADGDVAARNRRRKDRKTTSIEVDNKETQGLIISMEKLLDKVDTLNKNISEIFKSNGQAENMIPIV